MARTNQQFGTAGGSIAGKTAVAGQNYKDGGELKRKTQKGGQLANAQKSAASGRSNLAAAKLATPASSTGYEKWWSRRLGQSATDFISSFFEMFGFEPSRG